MSVAADQKVEVSPELGAIKQELLDARERARRLGESVAPGQWDQPADAGGWSIAHCLIHLNITSERFIPLIDDAIREGRERGLTATGPPARDFWGWLLSRMLEPPYRLKMKTGASFVPAQAEPMPEVLERFDYLQGELLVRLDRASGLALDRLRIVSPFDAKGRMRYNLYSAFRVLPVHQRRHLWQAEQIKARLAARS
jgi:DinB superfamily